MAQCSMKADEVARASREDRFKLCHPYLQRAVLAARAGTAETTILSVGQAPKSFLERHAELRDGIAGSAPIRRITHYSPLCNPHFSKFAAGRTAEFDAFVGRVSAEYEEFIKTGDNRTFSYYWDFYERSCPAGDMERIFMWRFELSGELENRS
jgi:hypothetical protein